MAYLDSKYMKEVKKKFKAYKYRADKKGLKFTLFYEQFVFIVTKACHYCGVEPKEKPHGIDRFKNDRGYTPVNCATSCWYCNRAKSNMSHQEFYKYLERFGGRVKKTKIGFRRKKKKVSFPCTNF